jgi:NADH-quinone oxidoreductase subunit L
LAYRPLAAAAEHGAAHGGMSHQTLAIVTTLVALVGVGAAAFLYLGDRSQVDALARQMRPVYQLSHGKFFLDQVYQVLFVAPLSGLARLSYWLDRTVIDGLVNLSGRVPLAVGSMLRSLQVGLVQFYALAMVLGLLVLIGTLLRWPLQ